MERINRDRFGASCGAGVTFPVLAMIMGWSPATAVRMAKRYGHIAQSAYRIAVESTSANASAAPMKWAEQGSFDDPFDLSLKAGTSVPKL